LGENFQKVPKEFVRARDIFKEKIVQYGYVESKREYIGWLKRGSVIVSSARQENFGISVVEAARYGCFPLLPRRLAYPEIIPRRFHDDVLYGETEELEKKLEFFIANVSEFTETRKEISKAMCLFSWENLIDSYDDALESLP